MQNRGKLLAPSDVEGVPSSMSEGRHVVATVHPSSVLRAPNSEARRAAFDMLVADLRVVAKPLRKALAASR